jgi:hypothetical protein
LFKSLNQHKNLCCIHCSFSINLLVLEMSVSFAPLLFFIITIIGHVLTKHCANKMLTVNTIQTKSWLLNHVTWRDMHQLVSVGSCCRKVSFQPVICKVMYTKSFSKCIKSYIQVKVRI